MKLDHRHDSPVDFETHKDYLLPVLYSRDHFEARVHLETPELDAGEFPYRPFAEHLAESIAFEVPKSMSNASHEPYENWGISWDEAFELARHNLRERFLRFSQVGSLYSYTLHSSFSASYLLRTDVIRELNVPGDKIAMVPDHRGLYVCGSEDDDGLVALAERAGDFLRHMETISGMAFRLVGDQWEPWLPPVDHPAYPRFKDLQQWTLARAYHDQKDLLDGRKVNDEPLFVASLSSFKNHTTGQQSTYSSWAEGVPTLLPKSDLVFFSRVKGWLPRPMGAARWETVEGAVGHLMERQDLYPPRYLVREFPGEEFLQQLRRPEELE